MFWFHKHNLNPKPAGCLVDIYIFFVQPLWIFKGPKPILEGPSIETQILQFWRVYRALGLNLWARATFLGA